MADLFGAPQGIIAAEEAGQKGSLATLGALKTMGEINAQPAELALRQSHARLYGAEADQKELANKQMLGMQNLDAQFNAEYAARQQLSEAAAAQGKIATIGDLTNNSAQATLSPSSLYQKSMARLAWMEKQGVPESILAGERDKVATGLEHLAIAGYRTQQGQEAAQRAQKERWQLISQAASTAASGPDGYMTVMNNPELAAVLPLGKGQLTGNYETDLPTLRMLGNLSTSAIKKAEFDQKKLVDTSTITRNAAQAAAAGANAGLATVRANVAKTVLNAEIKNGGEHSEAARDLKEASTEAKRLKMQAEHLATYNLAPLIPKDRVLKKAYTIGGGRVARWEINPATGQPGWNVLNITAPTSMRKPSPAARNIALGGSSADVTETADETGD